MHRHGHFARTVAQYVVAACDPQHGENLCAISSLMIYFPFMDIFYIL